MIDDFLLGLNDINQWCLDGTPYTGVAKTSRGSILWYVDGRYHREDGPAIVCDDGSKFWYMHGEIHREDGPAVEDGSGYNAWYIHDKTHREDGPAIEMADGHKEWWVHGKQHREDGPAVEFADGRKEWWIHNEEILTWKQYHKLSTLSPQEQMVVKLRYGEQLK